MNSTSTTSPPAVDPANVKVNSQGNVYRELFVYMPHGLTANDLADPAVWRKTQASPARLRDYDRVTMLAYDRTWLAEAWVASATDVRVELAKPRITTFPARYDRLLEDDRYRVVWAGTGYLVERKSDQHRMTHPVASLAVAERDLRQLYPTRVA